MSVYLVVLVSGGLDVLCSALGAFRLSVHMFVCMCVWVLNQSVQCRILICVGIYPIIAHIMSASGSSRYCLHLRHIGSEPESKIKMLYIDTWPVSISV